MKNIRIIGNSASPHVRSWVRILKTRFNIVVYDILRREPNLLEDLDISIIRPVRFPGLLKFKSLQYVLLGLWLRKQSFDGIMHAHNTSGYGLAALLSGKRYIVTTYGTEIYQAARRGLIYKWMIRRVLHRASLVTASSPYMTLTLEEQFGLDSKVVFCRHLLDQIFVRTDNTPKPSGLRTWFVNRRMTELYCTLDVVAAFKAFLARGGDGRLILLEGNADPDYAQRVAEASYGYDNIRVVPGVVCQTEIIKLLNMAHFTVSVPVSDQLSSAILEAAACQAVPIIRDLSSYEPIAPICIKLDNSVDLVSALTSAFFYTASLPDDNLHEAAVKAKNFTTQNFSAEGFIDEFSERVYDLS